MRERERKREREKGTYISVRQCESQKHKCIQLGLRAFLDKREFRNYFVDEKKEARERERGRISVRQCESHSLTRHMLLHVHGLFYVPIL